MPHDPARRRRAAWLRTGSLAGFAAVFLVFAATAPGFLSPGNLADIVQQSAVPGVLALGLTVVLIGGGSDAVTGGIDLSVAGNLGLSAAVFAVLTGAGAGDAAAAAATLATGLAIGLLNAVAIVRLRILPLLASLAVMNLCVGAELVLTRNTVLPATSPLLSALAGDGPFGLPVLAWALLVVALILGMILNASPAGLRLYAVGGNREAARAAGLPVGAYVAASYGVSGLCGGIAGILSAALLNGSTPGSGDQLLPVVVAALLGEVFSRRLVPGIAGTLLAVLFIGVLSNGFQLVNISSYWVNGVQGGLILFVVGSTALIRRGLVRHGVA